MILVTGGAGFIGSNFVLQWIESEPETVINLDRLTYAGNLQNLASLDGNPKHTFVHGCITDRKLLNQLFREYQPCTVVHFAAESHVDRSIHGPEEFIQTNVMGTFELLDAARTYWQQLPSARRDRFRFLHISTDEVYGSLGPGDPAFSETTWGAAEDGPFSCGAPDPWCGDLSLSALRAVRGQEARRF